MESLVIFVLTTIFNICSRKCYERHVETVIPFTLLDLLVWPFMKPFIHDVTTVLAHRKLKSQIV